MRGKHARRRRATSWRCLPLWQRTLTIFVPLLMLGLLGYAAVGRSEAAAPPPVVPAGTSAPVDTPSEARLPTQDPVTAVAAPTTAPSTVRPAPVISSSAPVRSNVAATPASAPALIACFTFRAVVEPTIRSAVELDDLTPVLHLSGAGGGTADAGWTKMMTAAHAAGGAHPTLQRDIDLLGQDIAQADPALSLAGLGSDLDAVEYDCQRVGPNG